MTYAATICGRIALAVAVVAGALMVVMPRAVAQPEPTLTILKVIPQQLHRDSLLKIAAEHLTVCDAQNAAMFRGDVHLVHADIGLRSDTLHVLYDDRDRAPSAPRTVDDKRVWRMDAHGGVVITRGEERATADRAEFHMQTNTITLGGNVVIRRGAAEMRGQRAIMDMKTDVVHMMPRGLLHREPYRSACS